MAQLLPDGTLGEENSVVTPNINIKGIESDRIDGGAKRGGNLFHSFQEFNVQQGRGVYFTNPDGVANILTRITGNNASNI
nr:filamentous hemagglutinin N-terminal domain-containing protein [Okeania sp. KiyG1]